MNNSSDRLSDPFLLDVTIRDGGYVNGHGWSVADAVGIVQAVDAAGVRFVEVGYLSDRDEDVLRPSATCSVRYLDTLAAVTQQARLVVMVRPGEATADQVSVLGDHGVGMVRVLMPVSDPEQIAPYIEAAKAGGVTVATNLTRVSERAPEDVAKSALRCAELGADLVYLADSNGSLFPESVRQLIAATVDVCDVPVGFHPHDNLGLAFINACVAVDAGATAVDATISGIGKSGGNLRLELIVAHWMLTRGADLRLDPLAHNVSTFAARLRMIVDGGSTALLSGLLDVNLDRSISFRRELATRGYDAVLRDQSNTQSDSVRLNHEDNTTRWGGCTL